MNKLYDNGSMLLGRKKDIEEYSKYLIKHYSKVGDDYVVETAEEILEEIKDFKDNDILCINYENGMGYSIDYWDDKDEVKVC